MKKTNKNTVIDCKVITSVINTYRLVGDRIKKLREFGYNPVQTWVRCGGVGTIRTKGGMNGIQISSTTASKGPVGLAYVVYTDSLAEIPTGTNAYIWLNNLK